MSSINNTQSRQSKVVPSFSGRCTLKEEAFRWAEHMVSRQEESHMSKKLLGLRHIFIDHSNMWGGARLASRIEYSSVSDEAAQ